MQDRQECVGLSFLYDSLSNSPSSVRWSFSLGDGSMLREKELCTWK